MYKVEFLNDNGDWVLKSWHQGKDHAEIMVSVIEEAGRSARIIFEGRVIYHTVA